MRVLALLRSAHVRHVRLRVPPPLTPPPAVIALAAATIAILIFVGLLFAGETRHSEGTCLDLPEASAQVSCDEPTRLTDLDTQVGIDVVDTTT